MAPKPPVGLGAPPPPPPLVTASLGLKGGASPAPPAPPVIPSDYATEIAEFQASMAPSPAESGRLPKLAWDTADNVGRIRASEITDPFVLELMQQKAIPGFRFVAGTPKLGIIEPVPNLPEEEFKRFITGLANVDEMFIFVEPFDLQLGEEGLFKWSIDESDDPSWALHYKKPTHSRRDVVIACYCNLWKRRAEKQFGCVFPIQSAISEGLQFKPIFHVK